MTATAVNPFNPVSRTANVERNGGQKWVNEEDKERGRRASRATAVIHSANQMQGELRYVAYLDCSRHRMLDLLLSLHTEKFYLNLV